MYHRNTNPIALRSQELISDALLGLMEKKRFSRITVTEICEAAGVGRKTFYRNFELKEDVIDFQVDALYGAYQRELEPLDLTDYLQHHFSFLHQNMAYLVLLFRNGLLERLTVRFAELMPRMMPRWSEDPLEQQYRAAYIAAGIEAVTMVWAENDFAQSVEELVQIVQRAQEKQIPMP